MEHKKKNNFGVAGFVLGFVSLFLMGLSNYVGMIISYLAFISVILGVIFSIIGIKSERKRLAITGLVINGILLIIVFIGIIWVIVSGLTSSGI